MFPHQDYTLASPLDQLPPEVGLTAVVVGFDAEQTSRAVAALVRHAIQSSLLRLRASGPPEAIGTGVRIRLGHDEPAPGRVAGTVDLRADLHRIGLRPPASEEKLPRIVVSIGLRRQEGWLVGGPRSDHDPTVPREPRLRRAALELTFVFGTDGFDAKAALVFYEAAALGLRRPEWRIDLSDGVSALVEEDRVLLGRPRPSSAKPTSAPRRKLPSSCCAPWSS